MNLYVYEIGPKLNLLTRSYRKEREALLGSCTTTRASGALNVRRGPDTVYGPTAEHIKYEPLVEFLSRRFIYFGGGMGAVKPVV